MPYQRSLEIEKGSYFPLRDPARRANNRAEEANEDPILLDPVVPVDTRLLCFAQESGAPMSAIRN